MPTPYVTDTLLTQQVANVLQTTPDQLPDQWANVIAQANLSASNDVRQCLMGNGFTATQIAAWDQLAVYCLDLGTFWTLTRMGVSNLQISDRALKALDRRDELRKTGVLMILDTPVAPTPGQTDVGGVTHGVSEDRERLSREYDREYDRTSRTRRW